MLDLDTQIIRTWMYQEIWWEQFLVQTFLHNHMDG